MFIDTHTPFNEDNKIINKITRLNWPLIGLLSALAGIGALSLYSAGGGSITPWAGKHIIRFMVLMGGAIIVSLINIRLWYRMTYPIYGIGLLLLIIVEITGHIGMGAQRWINLGFIQIQPSELMKIAVIMALAKYFHAASREDMAKIGFLIPPLLMIALPVALVLIQPDLGTSVMVVVAGIAMFFIAGAPYWMFITGGAAVAASIPVLWMFLHEYQKKRVMTFLNPESDPFGSGYHIAQSKIAIGSGGLEGKGFLKGSQSHLSFLPEKETDFIFTLWVEEWGFLGGLILLAINVAIILYGIWISFRCRHAFGQLLALGLIINYSLYVFINIGMVMGLIPVVGVPLPLVSYGGTAMLSVLIGFGLIMSASLHSDCKLPRMQ
ncbi:MAG: rod shape-determining protein RodA [Alphaproteobacteria bacterium]|nr:rod shape-determining protein RodA [Alphaproteobacteria bacterium]|tara:strand:- start:831 stop:1970 length:1140 start_codon:yes stop_codon:yes gene_type:complete